MAEGELGDRPAPTPDTDEPMSKAKILIVEDDLTTQEMARMILENAGYEVCVALSAEDAARLIGNFRPELVLMDRDLPGEMNGLDLTTRLKSSPDTANITVIAFSSSQEVADNEKAIAAGSDGFIHKPFTVRGLLQTIAWHIAARGNTGDRQRPGANPGNGGRKDRDDSVRHDGDSAVAEHFGLNGLIGAVARFTRSHAETRSAQALAIAGWD
jgi:CheY-like chemotaxis protein